MRTEAGLDAGLQELEEIATRGMAADERGLQFALETHNLLCGAEIVLRAARARPESRGPHLFFACPDAAEPEPTDDSWRKYTVIRRERGRMVLEQRRPVQLHRSADYTESVDPF